MVTPHALQVATLAWTALAIVTLVMLLRVVAPYGRHARGGWGPRIPAAVAWMAMEAPSPLGMLSFWYFGNRTGDPAAGVFLALWLAHYVYRTGLFPLLGRGKKAPMPLGVVASAVAFNVVNASLNGLWLFAIGPVRGAAWLTDPRLLGGLVVFAAGFAIHVRADAILRKLRGPGESGYRLPRGFLFEYVSCPNYLGEIVEWTGWAILTWSGAGLSFAVWTAANLVPRALAHHGWYRAQFADYPPQRRAVFPGLL